MDIKLKGFVNLFIEREVAEKLLKITSNNPEFESVKTQLETELSPRYEYKIKCRDCATTYLYACTRKLSEQEVKAGGICSRCSDDYK